MTRKYDAKAEQDYQFRASRKGAMKMDPYTGEFKPRSDFARGMHFQRFKDIKGKRKGMAKRLHSHRQMAVIDVPYREK